MMIIANPRDKESGRSDKKNRMASQSSRRDPSWFSASQLLLLFLLQTSLTSLSLYRSLFHHSLIHPFTCHLHLRLFHCWLALTKHHYVILQLPTASLLRHRTNRLKYSHWEIESHQLRILELSDHLTVSLLAVDCHRAAKLPLNGASRPLSMPVRSNSFQHLS